MEELDLLQKDVLLQNTARNGEWGSIEIEFQNGTAVRIRKTTIEKLLKAENNHARSYR
jgi:hypothetical protein